MIKFLAPLLLLCLLFAGAAPLDAAAKKARKPAWVVRRFPYWEISTPDGFKFESRQAETMYQEWWREWEKDFINVPELKVAFTLSERIFVAIGKNTETDCGGDPELDSTKNTTPIEGRHYGKPTRRYTVYSQKLDRGEKCMEHVYSVEDASGDENASGRIEVTYTYRVSYRQDQVPPGAVPSVREGGPNYQTYLQMLNTLKPRSEGSGGESRETPKKDFGGEEYKQ
ncbi:MAG TPA: hypothetical protein DCZ92_08785 [Elusimicrobia bacterium]|nr:MAG: hypothetical protein A2016_01735 [Elusimicrobia bacterium GWF2_62_30]HBA60901.1 hypothetical protein [Elusimicrobiota bacterium]